MDGLTRDVTRDRIFILVRPSQQFDTLDHPTDLTPDDHHPAPQSVTIFSSGTVSIPPGSTHVLDVTLPSADFQYGRCFLMGPHRLTPGGAYSSREAAEVYVTRDSDEAISHSCRDISFNRTYVATYSKQNSDAYLTHRIFDSDTVSANRYISLKDAVITGSILRLTFENFYGGSAWLDVSGQGLFR